MRVLVTGGSGVVGEAAVRALLQRGHRVRLLARHAEEDARIWPEGVEPHVGDVTDPASLAGAARGCEAVLHVVGIVREHAPASTFQAVNVDGTRHVVDEAARAGVPRFVYVSSLGAPTGESPYHRSKHAGELEAQRFPGRWVIVRPANVYGPGDEVISQLLRMVRMLPAVPVLAGGEQEFQPVWADDVGQALAVACEREDLAGRALDVAGTDRTTMHDLLDRFAALTGREPVRLPVPGFLARLGLKAADVVGVDLGLDEGQLTMLDERNVIARPEDNALLHVLGVTPTPLDDGLRRLLDALPEQLPAEGRGALHHKRFWADIVGASLDAPALFHRLCTRFDDVTPGALDLHAEPGTPDAVLSVGQTVTMAIPLRGHVQVRVAEFGSTSVTLQTLEGHAIAGAVRFVVEPSDGRDYRFLIELFDRAASAVDWVAMTAIGGRLQDATWRELVESMVGESGGRAADGVQERLTSLDGAEAERVYGWLEELATRRRHDANARAIADARSDATESPGVPRSQESRADEPRAAG
ncbi:MAG TPA: complex I NDUFA9 subunit family protein [Gemmatirosa sp.]|nr:complex I NDUFA9 subunit family protein [Gemmatirosa sp.]